MKKLTSKFVGKIVALSMSLVVCLGVTGCGSKPPADNQVTIWTAYSSEKILQDLDYSHRYASGKTVEIDVFKNEHEGAQLVFTPTLDVASYTLTTSDLKLVGDDSVTLPKETFEIFHQMYMPVTAIKDVNTLTGKGMYPEALMPYENAVMHKLNKVYGGDNQGIWIEAFPSETQTAGLYKGNWTLSIDGVNYTIPVEVNVYDYTLSDEKHSTSLFFSPWEDVAICEGNTTIELQESYANFLLEHRIEVGQLPGNDATIYNLDGALDTFIEQAKKVTNDERCTRYSFPYSHTSISCVRTVTNNKQLSLVDDVVTCTSKDYTKSILEKIAQASLDSDGVYNLLEKMETYYVYFDEYTSSDKLGEAQYTNIITPIWYAEVANHLIISMARERGYDSVLTTEEAEILGEYFDIIDRDRSLSVAFNETYTWESWAYGQFLLSLQYKSTDITPYNGMTGREYRKHLYRLAEYSRNYNQTAQTDFIDSVTTFGGYQYEFRPIDQIELLESAMAKLTAQFSEFEQEVLDDTKNMKNMTIGEYTENLDFKTIYCPTEPDYGSKSTQEFYDEFTHFWYEDDEAEVWSYTAIEPRDPNPSYHMEGALITSRLYSWMMYDYGIQGNLYWHIMLNRNYQRGNLEYVQDYYTNPIRYGGGRGANGEGFLLYPGKVYDVKWNGVDGAGDDITSPVASIRLKSIRDGLEEYDIMYAIDEFARNRAKVLGVTYDEKAFDNLLEHLVQNTYRNDKCILGSDYTDYAYIEKFHEIRNTIGKLVEFIANTGVTLDSFALEGGNVKLKLSAPVGVEVLVGGQVPANKTTVHGEDGQDYVVYDASFSFNASSATYLDIKVQGNSKYGVNIYLAGGYKQAEVSTSTADKDLDVDHFDMLDAGEGATATPVEDGIKFDVRSVDGNNPVIYVDLAAMNITTEDKQLLIKFRLDEFAINNAEMTVMARRRATGSYQDMILTSAGVKKDAGFVYLTCNLRNAVNSILIEINGNAVFTIAEIVVLR